MPRLLTSEEVPAMPTDLLSECLGEQLDGLRAAEQPQRLMLTLTARNVRYPIDVHNGVLPAAPTEMPPAGLPQVRFTFLTDPTGSWVDLLSLTGPPRFWFGLAVASVSAVSAPRPGADGVGAAAPRRHG